MVAPKHEYDGIKMPWYPASLDRVPPLSERLILEGAKRIHRAVEYMHERTLIRESPLVPTCTRLSSSDSLFMCMCMVVFMCLPLCLQMATSSRVTSSLPLMATGGASVQSIVYQKWRLLRNTPTEYATMPM